MAIYRSGLKGRKPEPANVAGVPSNDDLSESRTVFERLGLTANPAPAQHERPKGSIADHFSINQSSLYKPPS